MDELETAGGRARGNGSPALRDDPGHYQSLGTSPRTVDGLSAFDGSEGAGDLRTIGR